MGARLPLDRRQAPGAGRGRPNAALLEPVQPGHLQAEGPRQGEARVVLTRQWPPEIKGLQRRVPRGTSGRPVKCRWTGGVRQGQALILSCPDELLIPVPPPTLSFSHGGILAGGGGQQRMRRPRSANEETEKLIELPFPIRVCSPEPQGRKGVETSLWSG